MPIHPNVPEAFIAAYAHFNQPKETSELGFLATAVHALAGKMTPRPNPKLRLSQQPQKLPLLCL